MYEKILLPVDLTHVESQMAALESALAMSRVFASELHLLTVAPDMNHPIAASYYPDGFADRIFDQMDRELNAFIARHVAPTKTPAKASVREGVVYREILDYAESEGIDLIVMASHRPELSDYLIGPNAARITRHADCSVLVVRAPSS